MEVIYPLSGMTDLISSISGSTDPFFVGNRVNATIAQSTKNTPATSDANKQTVKSNFFQQLIDLITQTLANAVCTAPQIRALLAISSAFSNHNVPQIGNPLDDMKKYKIFLKCNLNAAMALINKFIYDLVITFLIALIAPVIRKIIKEKINQYSKQIKSLAAPSIPT
jgi:3-dehydroquinate dehydratase